MNYASVVNITNYLSENVLSLNNDNMKDIHEKTENKKKTKSNICNLVKKIGRTISSNSIF